MMLQFTRFFCVLAFVSGARVDDDTATGPGHTARTGPGHTARQALDSAIALNPDGTPQTIEEKADTGEAQAKQAVADAKLAQKLTGEAGPVQVPYFETKLATDEENVHKFYANQAIERSTQESKFAHMAYSAAVAAKDNAKSQLKLDHNKLIESETAQRRADLEAQKAEMKHESTISLKTSGESLARGSAMSTAGAAKVLETSKSWKDESEANLEKTNKSLADAKNDEQVAEAKQEYVYGLQAHATRNFADKKSEALQAEKKLQEASLRYDKAYTIHKKLVPIVAGTAATAHSASEAEALATDKAFAAIAQVDVSDKKFKEAQEKAEELAEHSKDFELSMKDVDQAKKVVAAASEGSDDLDANATAASASASAPAAEASGSSSGTAPAAEGSGSAEATA